MIYASRKKWYDVIGAVKKQSAVADKTFATVADICFFCTINEKAFDEGKHGVRKHGLSSLNATGNWGTTYGADVYRSGS